MSKSDYRTETVVGLALIACVVTGLAGLVSAIFAFFSADWMGAGLCLIASALAFGLLILALVKTR